jgi:hypothetical protein
MTPGTRPRPLAELRTPHITVVIREGATKAERAEVALALLRDTSTNPAPRSPT